MILISMKSFYYLCVEKLEVPTYIHVHCTHMCAFASWYGVLMSVLDYINLEQVFSFKCSNIVVYTVLSLSLSTACSWLASTHLYGQWSKVTKWKSANLPVQSDRSACLAYAKSHICISRNADLQKYRFAEMQIVVQIMWYNNMRKSSMEPRLVCT